MNQNKPGHPSREELIALTIDDLPAARAAEIREHLLDCAECLEATRALLRLPDHAPSPEEEVSDAEEAAAWQRLSATIGTAKGTAPAPPSLRALPGGGQNPRAQPSVAKKPARPFSWLLVAAALVVAAGVGLLVRRTDDTVARTHLLPSDFSVRGPGDNSNTSACPPVGGTFAWTMDYTKRPAEVKEVQVLLRHDGGAAVFQKTQGVDAEGRITLEAPWALITDGKYLVEVSAGENPSPAVKEEFLVSVACR